MRVAWVQARRPLAFWYLVDADLALHSSCGEELGATAIYEGYHASGAEPPGAKALPRGDSRGSAISQISVNAVTDSRARCAQRSDTPIEVLREGIRKRSRLTALLRRVHGRGQRLTVELILELADPLDAHDLIVRKGCGRQPSIGSFSVTAIGHELPPRVTRIVSRGCR
jgi:hypothetical protein